MLQRGSDMNRKRAVSAPSLNHQYCNFGDAEIAGTSHIAHTSCFH